MGSANRSRSTLGVLLVTFLLPAAVPAVNHEFKPDKIYHGFRFLQEREIPEINATGLLFVHKKTGARLLKLATDDDNKSFAITFKTPPEGDYGIPHILEHSVLEGSRKFPVKSPFQVLAKGSLNTFLNAMTAPDFTMYPVASTNTKDFFNLMDVYLDAVLYPRIHQDPRIFLQEGWRYELEDKDAPLTYNGIVYNEMKGAFSSPERVLDFELSRALFPDSPYGLSSGGHPQAIPELARQQLLVFHKKYYHPSNAFITLWGDGDTLAELKFIHEKYLKDFRRKKIDSTIPLQKPFDQIKSVHANYPVASSEDPKDKTYLAFAWVGGSPARPAEAMALDVLSDVLVNRPASPLRKALEDAGIGKDAYAYFSDTKQGVFEIVVKNANPEDRKRFRELVYDTLAKLAEEGLDKRLVEGVINKLEFRLREADYGSFPPGLVYTFFGIRGWLFADDPFLGVAYEKPLAEVRKALTSEYLEGLIRKFLIDNPHGALAVVEPKPGLEDEINEKREKKLAATKASMQPARIEKIVEQTRELKAWQAKPDDPEDLAKIPMLSLEDLSPKEKRLDVAEKQVDGTRVLHFAHPTNGIVYLQLMFDSRVVPQELLPHLVILSDLLGELDTRNYTYGALDTELSIHTGGVGFGVQTYQDVKNTESYQPKLVIRGKVLEPKLDKLLALMEEVALRTRFDDRERVKDVLEKMFSRYQGMARNAGQYLAVRRLESYLSPYGAYLELTGGLHFIQFMADLVQHYDERADALLADLAFVSSLVFNRNNLVVGVTCPQGDFTRVEKLLPALLGELDTTERTIQAYRLTPESKNEGLVAASKVQYVTQGADFRKLGHPWTGRLSVLQQILSRDYLTNEIRVQGGAYGAWASFGRNGFGYFGSYRDPHLKKTLEVYDGLAGYLKGFEADDRAMTRYIIGVIARRDRPVSPASKGERAISYLLENVTNEDRQEERTQILATRQDDIRKLAPLVQSILAKDIICVYGNEKKLQDNKDLFERLVKVLE